MTAEEAWVWLARIRRPQGRKGEVYADILTDFPERFTERRRLWLFAEPTSKSSADAPASASPSREVELVAHWLHKGGIVLHFAGISSISDAETLAGLVAAIPRSERAPLGEDEIYIGDLIGCELFDVAAAEPVRVGVVEQVDRAAGPVALLVVRSERGEVLIPFAKHFLRLVDTEHKRMEMALPEGLVDLNL